MNVALKPLDEIVHITNQMFAMAAEGVDDSLARKQVKDGTNSLLWLIGHIATCRYYILNLCGIEAKSPWGELFESSIDKVDQTKFPGADEIKRVWDEVGVQMVKALETVSDSRLAEPSPFKFPTKEQTVLAGITFMVMHESYHIGQISSHRKMLGIDSLFELAMKKRKAQQQAQSA